MPGYKKRLALAATIAVPLCAALPLGAVEPAGASDASRIHVTPASENAGQTTKYTDKYMPNSADKKAPADKTAPATSSSAAPPPAKAVKPSRTTSDPHFKLPST